MLGAVTILWTWWKKQKIERQAHEQLSSLAEDLRVSAIAFETHEAIDFAFRFLAFRNIEKRTDVIGERAIRRGNGGNRQLLRLNFAVLALNC